MFELTLENQNGDQLTFGMGTPFTITEIDGLDPPEAEINTSEIALIDGAKFNSSKLETRQVNIAFAIEYSAPYNRTQIYKVLKSKQYIKIYYKGDYRDVYCEGYIKDINISYFEMKQIATVEILCPDPYLRAADEIVTEMTNIIGAFHFPFASTSTPELLFSYLQEGQAVYVENGGDVECGLIFEVFARDDLYSSFKIWNAETNEFFGLKTGIPSGNTVIIDTRRGHKSVLEYGGTNVNNLISLVEEGSTWFQLPSEGAYFIYEVDEDSDLSDLLITIKHEKLYQGV